MTVPVSTVSMMTARCSFLAAVCAVGGATVLYAGGGPAAHLRAPEGLRCGNHVEPLAVGAEYPELSWQLTASAETLHGMRQSAYELEVMDGDAAPGGKALVWDSGKTASAETTGVVYGGPALEAGHGYRWRVRVWDEDGRVTAWSGWAHWRQAPVWKAGWIAAPAIGGDDSAQPLPVFRKSFRLTQPVKRAVVYVSGLGQDELRLNGQKVGRDELAPGWTDYHKTVEYNAYDVTRLLRRGENALGILLGNGMYRVFKTEGRYTKFEGSYGPLMCTLQMRVELADGEVVDVATDGTWKTTAGPITFSSTYGGEDFDARREPAGWDTAGFDDAAWTGVRVVAGPGGVMTAEIAPPVRVMRRWPVVKVTRPKPGVLVYDLGQNFAGWPAIAVSGPAGAVVKLIPGELLHADGTVSQLSSGEPQWFAYTLRGKGVERWHPRFSYYGFRYVQVEGASTSAVAGKARMISVVGEAVHTSSEAVGSFASSEELLSRIHTLIVRAIENNSVSLFTDCPHREKLGWLEETHLMAPSLLYDFDFAGLFAATARNIADEQRTSGAKAGMVAEIAPQYVLFIPPDGGPFDDSPEWGSAAVLAPWYAFERSGDRAFLKAQMDVMRRYTAYLGTRANDGIIAYGLGDWYDIGPGEPGMSKLTTAGVTASAIYYQDLKVMERATALLGDADESRGYAAEAEAERRLFNARFFNADKHVYDTGSQTAQAMPLVTGLAPDGERAAVLDALVKDIHAHGDHVTAGDIGYHYVVDALLQGGRSDVLLAMLERTDTPSYGYQLAQGATALTEAWDADPQSSQDHFMLGHAEEWFYRGLGGITVDQTQKEPEQIVIHPQLVGKVSWVRTRYRTVRGAIVSDWHRGPGGVDYAITIPPNSAATIELDGVSPDGVTIDGRGAAKAAGVESLKVTEGGVRLVVGSGSYRVHAARSAL